MFRALLYLAFGMLATSVIATEFAAQAPVNCAGVSIPAGASAKVQHELSRARCVAEKH